MSSTNCDDRAAFIDGLLALACFLEEHPDVPVPAYGTKIYVCTSGSDDENVSTVDAAAAVFGVAASWNDRSTHYDTAVSFGPVEYEVGAITRAHMAGWTARHSYNDSVRVDDTAVAA